MTMESHRHGAEEVAEKNYDTKFEVSLVGISVGNFLGRSNNDKIIRMTVQRRRFSSCSELHFISCVTLSLSGFHATTTTIGRVANKQFG